MKILIDKNPRNTKVVDDDGNDISESLSMTEITISQKYNELPEATIIGFADEAAVQVAAPDVTYIQEPLTGERAEKPLFDAEYLAKIIEINLNRQRDDYASERVI